MTIEKKMMNKALHCLKKKSSLLFPTDTVFGLGGMLTPKVIENIFAVKKRGLF
jgi:tRNA A37 threonylcarbamoyladenosine synthetase subunit TsaC/SUA5/YrdC